MENTVIKKIGFISLGCSKNQIDTEIMLSILVDEGYEIVTEEIHADLIIVNTCAFIEDAKKEAIDNILDVAWLKQNRELKGIVVCGCLSERYKEEIFTELPEVDAVIGVGSIKKIAEAVRAVEEQVNKRKEEKYISLLPKEELELGGGRVLTTPEYSAYIKISEGCNNCCTYCAIPSIRGGLRSRDMESIVDEANDLARLGVKELIVIAQDTTSYGIDLYGEYKLPELLNRLCKTDGIEWIRLLYCYPDKITDELIQTIKRQDKILKYIDIPVQHINDNILKAMNRKGTREDIERAIGKLRSEIPDIIIRSTLILGFPGETKKEFDELCKFTESIKFERLGVFAYSPEEDTAAASLSGQVSETAKKRRADTVMSIQERNVYSFNQNRIGTTERILCEGFDKAGETYFGRSYADSPEIDCKVYFSSERKIEDGEFVDVIIDEIIDFDVLGRVL